MSSAISLPKRGITISLLLEFILAVAIGLALQQSVARANFASHGMRTNVPLMPFRIFLVGFAATLSLGLAAETSQHRKEPIRWGLGRWTTSVVAVSSVLVIGDFLARLTIECLQGRKVPEPEAMLAATFIILSYALMWLPYVLGGLWLVARFSGRRVQGIVDAREWSGRLVAVGFLTITLVGVALGERSFGW